MRIAVTKPGLYVLRASQLAPLMELRTSAATSLIRSGRLALTNQGHRVAVLAARDGSALYFYGEAISTPYTSTNIYYLGRGRATVIQRTSPAVSGTPATSFTDTVHVEKNLRPMPAKFHDPVGDFWLWNYEVAGSRTPTFEIDAPSPEAGRTLRVSLLGLDDTGTPNEHHVRVTLNGVTLGDVRFAGATPATASFTIPAGVLNAGANTVTVSGILDTGAPYSMVAVDSFDLTYTRSADAVDDQLMLDAATAGPRRVTGLAAGPGWVFDVTDP
ncbi:MAG: hypothetical protein WCN81_09465, partial [Actinomycetes bacterium]